MKKATALFLIICTVFLFGGCAKKEEKPIKISVLSGPTGIGILPLWDKAEKGETKLDFEVETVGDNDKIVADVSSGRTDIAAISSVLAAALYDKTEKNVSVIAVNTLGVLYMYANEEISDFSSLRGKRIYTIGQGANPEYILEGLLKKNGLSKEDVEINFLSEGSELLSVPSKDEDAVIMAPQPVASLLLSKNPNLKEIFDLSKEWEKAYPSSALTMGALIVRNDFLKNHKKEVGLFLEEYEKSVKEVNENPSYTAKLSVEKGLMPNEQVADKAIKKCSVVYITGKEMKEKLSSYLSVMYEINQKSVGGSLPDDGFYYG